MALSAIAIWIKAAGSEKSLLKASITVEVSSSCWCLGMASITWPKGWNWPCENQAASPPPTAPPTARPSGPRVSPPSIVAAPAIAPPFRLPVTVAWTSLSSQSFATNCKRPSIVPTKATLSWVSLLAQLQGFVTHSPALSACSLCPRVQSSALCTMFNCSCHHQLLIPPDDDDPPISSFITVNSELYQVLSLS